MDIKVWPRQGVSIRTLTEHQTFLIDGGVYMLCTIKSNKVVADENWIHAVSLSNGCLYSFASGQLVIPTVCELNCYEV
uniref:Uncharacterized protein n=1 Tax=Pseudomonas phage Baskent_P1_112 TaxID=3145032 RepID=A0AAU8BBD0_9CAUD